MYDILYAIDGTQLDYTNPTKTTYTPKRIATILSRTYRFNREVHYSVARHCMELAHYFQDQNQPDLAYIALMHELDELLIGDIPTPLKRKLYLSYPELKEELDSFTAKLCYEYKVEYPFPEVIHVMDKRMATTEHYNLKQGDFSLNVDWDMNYQTYPPILDRKTGAPKYLYDTEADITATEFLTVFYDLAPRGV